MFLSKSKQILEVFIVLFYGLIMFRYGLMVVFQGLAVVF